MLVKMHKYKSKKLSLTEFEKKTKDFYSYIVTNVVLKSGWMNDMWLFMFWLCLRSL